MLVYLGGDGDLQLAVGVQLGGLVEHLLVGVALEILLHLLRRVVVGLAVVAPVPVPCPVHDILDFRAGDRFAEEK